MCRGRVEHGIISAQSDCVAVHICSGVRRCEDVMELIQAYESDGSGFQQPAGQVSLAVSLTGDSARRGSPAKHGIKQTKSAAHAQPVRAPCATVPPLCGARVGLV
ncbi:PREDICTED: uncharacterized protein LOC106126349 isoform X2 [Papilio xuthus]|uniref:Uncharacterized protein LOC106126349 isoform X2 n=1 Tax=Papilio xuthus TaxID=66420 RepID=A0AAJ7EJ79_PAPXU|nr:PREDICTED: uncharacterized protein LOC106126349 isoform X2 [Papilio xuthus]